MIRLSSDELSFEGYFAYVSLKWVTQIVVEGSVPSKISQVHALPFINLETGKVRCIFTTRVFAANECKGNSHEIGMVTFDRPHFY